MHSLPKTVFLLAIASSVVAYDNVSMTCLVNKERTDRGLKPLSIDKRLIKAAQGHSDDQARMRRMTHDGSDGSEPGDRCTRAGYDWMTQGENVAYGFSDEASVMKAWMKSPGHKANILRALFHDFGSAVAYRSSVPYYTQSFGSLGTPGKNVPRCNSDKDSKTITKKSVKTYVRKTAQEPAAGDDKPRADYNYVGGKYGDDGTGEYEKGKPANPAPGPKDPAPGPKPGPPAPGPDPDEPEPPTELDPDDGTNEGENPDEDKKPDEDENPDEGKNPDGDEKPDKVKKPKKLKKSKKSKKKRRKSTYTKPKKGKGRRGKRVKNRPDEQPDEQPGEQPDDQPDEKADPKTIFGRHAE